MVSIDSINTLRARRRSGVIVPESAPEIAETVPEAMRDLALRLESRAAEAAELRTRLELTTQTQSSIEEERTRLEEALAREQGRAQDLQAEAKKLQAELEAERSKGFWRRLFEE